MKNYSLFLLSIVFLLACNSEEEYSRLKLVSSVKINETEDLAIEIPRQADFISDTTMLLLATKTDIYKFNPISGNLSPFVSIDSAQIQDIFKLIKSKYPDLTFLQDSSDIDDFIIYICDFQIANDFVYLNIDTKFKILGNLGDLSASIVTSFFVIQKYNLKNKQLVDEYVITFPQKTNYTIKNDSIDLLTEIEKKNYSAINTYDSLKGTLASSLGLYIYEDKNKIYSREQVSPFGEKTHFLVEFDFNKTLDDSNKNIVNIFHKKDKFRITETDVSFCSFYKSGEQLFCCDSKDIFMVYPEPKLYKEIVFNKFYSIKSFKILANDDILYRLKCDTSNYSVVNILKKDKIVNLLPDTNTRKLYLIQNGIHSIVLSGENYYFRTYKNM